MSDTPCRGRVLRSGRGGLPDDDAAVYRARVKLDAGKWEYRVVGDLLDGDPTQWHPGPVVE